MIAFVAVLTMISVLTTRQEQGNKNSEGGEMNVLKNGCQWKILKIVNHHLQYLLAITYTQGIGIQINYLLNFME